MKLSSSLSALSCLGFSHHHTPIAIREQVSIGMPALPRALSELKKLPSISEAFILSTCNRLELYTVSETEDSAVETLTHFLATFHCLPNQLLKQHAYYHTGFQATQQLFRVATALDALVVGEPQILGQVKKAYKEARNQKAIGPLLEHVLAKVFYTAKRVRAETLLSRYPVTVSFAAVELAKKIFGDLKGLKCALLGTGEMSLLAAKSLHKRGAELLFINRSLQKAEKLATDFQGQAFSLNQLDNVLHHADAIIASTGASHFLINSPLVQKAMRKRRYRPLLLIDISVPRNIDPACSHYDGIYLYNIDDLRNIVDDNLQNRYEEIELAEKIIDKEIKLLANHLLEHEAVPFITSLKQRAHHTVSVESKKTLSQLEVTLSEKDQQKVIAMGHAIANKLLHSPIVQLKTALQQSETHMLDKTRFLFRLDGES